MRMGDRGSWGGGSAMGTMGAGIVGDVGRLIGVRFWDAAALSKSLKILWRRTPGGVGGQGGGGVGGQEESLLLHLFK